MNKKKIIDALKHRGIEFNPNGSVAELNLLLRESWLQIRNQSDQVPTSGGAYEFEMTISGQIGTDYYGDQGYSAKQFQDELKPFQGKRGILLLHSQGGNVWDAFAIAEMVRNHGNLDTKVLGLAASSADVIFQAGKTRIMPQMAMRMAHNPSSMFLAVGNAEELRNQKTELDKTIDRLDKHADTLAKMYCSVSGNSMDDSRAMMNAEEFMDGDESLEKGYCDQLSQDVPVTDSLDLSMFKNAPAAVLNQFSTTALPKQGERKNQQGKDNTVNKQQKFALLASWQVRTNENMTDTELDSLISKGDPRQQASAVRAANIKILNGWGVKFKDDASDADIEALVAKGKPVDPPAPQNIDDHPTVKAMKSQMENARKSTIRASIEKFASENRIPVNQIDEWVNDAVAAQDDPAKGNPIINRLAALPQRMPGVPPVSIEIGDNTPMEDMLKGVNNALTARNAMIQGRVNHVSDDHRRDLDLGARAISRMLRKQIENVTKGIEDVQSGAFNKRRAEAISSWMDAMPVMNDSTYSGVTVASDLQRQVIMSESMRAFRRRLAPLSVFAHNFNSVPLQGNDQIIVPYYPLFTTASQRFIAPGTSGAAAGQTGYLFNSGTDQAARKTLTVGGVGDLNKTAGRDRAYQGLTLSAYLIRRQPWIDIQRLAVMRTEQLAVDILNDIITAWVLKANFGTQAWAGAPAAFDDTAVAFLAGVSRKSDWPETMRNLVIGTDYWVNLVSTPYVKAFLNIGDTGAIRDGRIGGLYGFEDTIENPRIPVTADGNLVGWISYPSAVLVATSPILPAPGEMKLMVSYDLVVDDQTGLAFEYKYWGEPWNSLDREIVECNYGSGLGELAALKRIVATADAP